jgi:hypothetical protein
LHGSQPRLARPAGELSPVVLQRQLGDHLCPTRATRRAAAATPARDTPSRSRRYDADRA